MDGRGVEALSRLTPVTWLAAVLAVVVVVVGGGTVAARRRTAPRPVRIDPFTIGEPWRRHVSAAQSTQRRYLQTVATVAPGPLHDRLSVIGTRVQHSVEECWQIAKRGAALDDTLRRLDSASIGRQLERAVDDSTKASLQAQLDAAARIRATRDSTDERLRGLDARLGELVTQAAEISTGADTTDELGGAVDDVITELEALRLAIDDVNSTGRGPSGNGTTGITGTSPTT